MENFGFSTLGGLSALLDGRIGTLGRLSAFLDGRISTLGRLSALLDGHIGTLRGARDMALLDAHISTFRGAREMALLDARISTLRGARDMVITFLDGGRRVPFCRLGDCSYCPLRQQPGSFAKKRKKHWGTYLHVC